MFSCSPFSLPLFVICVISLIFSWWIISNSIIYVFLNCKLLVKSFFFDNLSIVSIVRDRKMILLLWKVIYVSWHTCFNNSVMIFTLEGNTKMWGRWRIKERSWSSEIGCRIPFIFFHMSICMFVYFRDDLWDYYCLA